MNEDEVQQKANEKLLFCPQCKINIPKINNIYVNSLKQVFIILECKCTSTNSQILLSEYLKILSTIDQTQQCQNHPNKTGVKYCSLCNESYCFYCTQNHNLTNSTHLLNSKANFIIKCKDNRHEDHTSLYLCKTCNKGICFDCVNKQHKTHEIISNKNIHTKLSINRSNISISYYNNKLNEEVNRNKALIEKIEEIIRDLQLIHSEIKEYIDNLNCNNDIIELAQRIITTFDSTNAEYNINASNNFEKIKLKPEKEYIDISKGVNDQLNNIKGKILVIKETIKVTGFFLFEIKQYVTQTIFSRNPLLQMPILYSSNYTGQNLICIKEKNDVTYKKQLKDGNFLGTKNDGNKLIIENIYTNSIIVSSEETLNKPSFFELQNGNIFYYDSSNYLIIIDRNTLQTKYSAKTNLKGNLAVEISETIIALVSLNCIYFWSLNNLPYVKNVFQSQQDIRAMIKYDSNTLAFASGNIIKLFNCITKTQDIDLFVNENGNVEYLFKDTTNMLLISDQNSTIMLFIDPEITIVHYPNIVTRNAIRLSNKTMIGLINTAEVLTIWCSKNRQIILTVNLMNIENLWDLFLSIEGKLGLISSSGIFLLS